MMKRARRKLENCVTEVKGTKFLKSNYLNNAKCQRGSRETETGKEHSTWAGTKTEQTEKNKPMTLSYPQEV